MTNLFRLALSLSVFVPLLGCVDPDEPELGEASSELVVDSYVESGLYVPVVPTAFRGDDFRVQVVGARSDGALVWDIQEEPGRWIAPNPTSIGTYPIATQHVTAAQQEDGKTVVFAIWGSTLVRSTQIAPYSRYWGPWIQVGYAQNVAPSIARNQDGRLEGVYLGLDGRVKQLWQQSINGAWSAPYDTGVATTGTPEIVRDPQHRLEILVPIASGACGVKHWRQVAPNGWTGWRYPLLAAGPCVNNLAVGYYGSATEVLAQSSNGAIHRFSRATSDALFRAAVEVWGAGPQSPPTMITKDDGRLLAFTAVRTCSQPHTLCGRLYVNERFGGATWSGWRFFAYAAEPTPVAVAESWIDVTQAFVRMTGDTRQYDRSTLR